MLISALKTLAPSRFPVVIDGYHKPADGGEGIFKHHYHLPEWASWIDFDSPGPHEDGGIVVQSMHDGYWIRRQTDAVNIRWFGAMGDGIADDTDAFIKACMAAQNLCGDYATVYFPAGSYKGNFIAEDVSVIGHGTQTVLIPGGTNDEVIRVTGSYLHLSNLLVAGNANNIGIRIHTTDPQFDLNIESIQFINCRKDIVQCQDHDAMTWIDYNIKDSTGLNIYDSNIASIKLIGSNVNLHHCLQDAMENGYQRNNIDEASTLEAYDHYYNYTAGEDLFVHSIGYDGSFDIHQLTTPTSVRGPLRTNIEEQIQNVLISEHFSEGKEYLFDADTSVPGSHAVIAKQVNDGVLKGKCVELTLQPFNVVRSLQGFTLGKKNDKYYAWSIHAYQCGDENPNSVSATIRNDLGESLGQLIFRKGEWTCSYGVKQMDFTPSIAEDNNIHLYIDGGEHGGTIRLCDWQVVAFDTLKQATEFANSRVFAD